MYKPTTLFWPPSQSFPTCGLKLPCCSGAADVGASLTSTLRQSKHRTTCSPGAAMAHLSQTAFSDDYPVIMLFFTHNMSHSLAHMRRNDAVHAHVGDSCMSMHVVEESPAFSLHTSLPVSYGTPAGTNVMMTTGGSSRDTPLLPIMKQKDIIQNSGSVIEFCFSSLDLQR